MGMSISYQKMFRRGTILNAEKSLVILEQRGSKDRMRRILYDRVDALLVWKKLPWVTMLLFTLIMGLLATPIFMLGGTAAYVIAGIIVGIALLLNLYWIVSRRTHLRLIRAGTPYDFDFIMRPGKVRRFVDEVRTNIVAVQEKELVAAQARQTAKAEEQRRAMDALSGGAMAVEEALLPPVEGDPGETPTPDSPENQIE